MLFFFQEKICTNFFCVAKPDSKVRVWSNQKKCVGEKKGIGSTAHPQAGECIIGSMYKHLIVQKMKQILVALE